MTHPTIQAFLDDLARQGRPPATRRGYRADLEAFAAWVQQSYNESFDPAHIVREDIRAYRAHLLSVQRRKPATVNRRLAAVRAFCRWLVATGVLASDPTAGIPPVPQAPAPPKALEATDLRRLIRRAQAGGNPLHIAAVVLLANTGLRVSELCGLRLGDVEMGERRGRVIVRSGKGEKYREVPLEHDHQALEALLAWRDAQGVYQRNGFGQGEQALAPGRLGEQFVDERRLPAARPAGKDDEVQGHSRNSMPSTPMSVWLWQSGVSST